MASLLKSVNIVIVTFIIHEVTWAIQEQVANLLNIFWMTEPMSVAKGLDDSWIGVKG